MPNGCRSTLHTVYVKNMLLPKWDKRMFFINSTLFKTVPRSTFFLNPGTIYKEAT
ncbi:hypothetical protein JCM17204_26070 [Blautia stercoris]